VFPVRLPVSLLRAPAADVFPSRSLPWGETDTAVPVKAQEGLQERTENKSESWNRAVSRLSEATAPHLNPLPQKEEERDALAEGA
jgi:hypothetical protein